VLHSSLPEFLQGIEGTYISHHPEYSPEDDDPLKGIRFVVSSPLGLSNCSTEIVLSHTFYRFVPSRPNGTDSAPWHLLYSYLLFCREPQPPRFWACQSCALRFHPGHAQGQFLPSLRCRFTHPLKGLPNSPLSTRTCIQHLSAIQSTEIMVLCPPDSAYPVPYLSAYPRTGYH
jgi:hypothetical protein